MRFRPVCLMLSALAACTPASPPAELAGAAPSGGRPDPEAIGRTLKTDAYTRINATPIEGTNPAHFGPLSIYVDKAHAHLYRKDFKGAAPAGMTVVKTDSAGRFVAIMSKLPPGRDPGAGDWFFYEKSGDSVLFDGNRTPGGGFCASCHKAATETDLLRGTRVYGP